MMEGYRCIAKKTRLHRDGSCLNPLRCGKPMLKLIAGNDRAIAAYSRARNWTPLGAGRYADEHGSAVRRLFQPRGSGA